MNKILQLPVVNTTLSKMETVVNSGRRKHFNSIEFDGFKVLFNYGEFATIKHVSLTANHQYHG